MEAQRKEQERIDQKEFLKNLVKNATIEQSKHLRSIEYKELPKLLKDDGFKADKSLHVGSETGYD